MNQPTFPKHTLLSGRVLARLLSGRKMTHRDFQNETATYRLSGYIERLRNFHGWDILCIKNWSKTSDPAGRYATYGRYEITPENLVKYRKLLGAERIEKFIEAVKRFEAKTAPSE